MANKPKYIGDLESKVENLQRAHDENAVINSEILRKLNTIEICLKGTEYNSDEGGLVKRVNNNAKSIIHIKRNMAKRDGIIATATGVLTALITLFLNWILHKK